MHPAHHPVITFIVTQTGKKSGHRCGICNWGAEAMNSALVLAFPSDDPCILVQEHAAG
jgi:hypothetical protein